MRRGVVIFTASCFSFIFILVNLTIFCYFTNDHDDRNGKSFKNSELASSRISNIRSTHKRASKFTKTKSKSEKIAPIDTLPIYNLPIVLVLCVDQRPVQENNTNDWLRNFKRQEDQIRVLLGSMLINSRLSKITVIFVTDTVDTYNRAIDVMENWPSTERNRLKLERVACEIPDNEFFEVWRPCAWGKWFLGEVLPNHDAVIYVDTDFIFLGPIEDLMQEIGWMNHNEVVGLGSEAWYLYERTQGETRPIAGSSGLNTGILLLNLTRTRQLPDNSLGYVLINEMRSMHSDNVRHDQDVANSYFSKHPDAFMELTARFHFNLATCIINVPCIGCREDGIVAFHGSAASFHYKGDKRLQSVYKVLKLATSTLDMDKKTLLARLKLKLSNVDTDGACKRYKYFKEMMIANMENMITQG